MHVTYPRACCALSHVVKEAVFCETITVAWDDDGRGTEDGATIERYPIGSGRIGGIKKFEGAGTLSS